MKIVKIVGAEELEGGGERKYITGKTVQGQSRSELEENFLASTRSGLCDFYLFDMTKIWRPLARCKSWAS